MNKNIATFFGDLTRAIKTNQLKPEHQVKVYESNDHWMLWVSDRHGRAVDFIDLS